MIPPCPRCGTRMVERVNGATGLAFWGCPSYPRCRGTRTARARPQDASVPASPHATGARERDALIRELTRLLSVIHPDKWGGESAVATALTQEVLTLRTRLLEERR